MIPRRQFGKQNIFYQLKTFSKNIKKPMQLKTKKRKLSGIKLYPSKLGEIFKKKME